MATSVLPDVATVPAVEQCVPTIVKLQRVAAVSLLLLYLLSVSPRWFIESDSALYLMLADNLASGEGYTLWGAPHAHVPPGYPSFLAGMKQLGLGSMWWLNLSTVLMVLAILWLTYHYVSQRATAAFALLVALTLGFSHEMHTAGMLLMSDVLFTLLVWVGLCCYGRGLKQPGYWLETGTLALIASCWVRAAGFPLAAGAALGVVLHQRDRIVAPRRVWLNAAGLLLGIGLSAYGFYSYHERVTAVHTVQSYSGYVESMAERSDWQWIVQPGINLWETGRGVLRLLTGQQHNVLGSAVIGLAWLPIVLGMGIAWRRGQRLGVCCVLGYVLVLTVNESLMGRYLLPLAPLLIWYVFEGVHALALWMMGTQRRAQRATILLAVVLFGFNVPHSLSYTCYAHRPEMYRRYTTWREIELAARFLRQNAQPGERFVAGSHQRQIAYLSQVWPARLTSSHFYRSAPSEAEYDQWVRDGMVFLVKWKNLPPETDEMLTRVCQRHEFQSVLTSDSIEIYSRRPVAVTQPELAAPRTVAQLMP